MYDIMFARGILLYAQQQHDIFLDNFYVARATAEEDAIHDLRVALKKLRAICRLLHPFDKRKLLRTALRAIQPFYKAAGRLRDLHVQGGLVRQYAMLSEEPYEDLLAFLENREVHAQVLFDQQVHLLDEAAICDLLVAIEQVLDQVGDKKLRRHCLRQIEKGIAPMASVVQGNYTDEQLHGLRTRLKHTTYLMQLFNQCAFGHQLLHLSTDRPKALGEELGHWHDQVVLHACLQEFRAAFPEHSLHYIGLQQTLALGMEQDRQAIVQTLLSDQRSPSPQNI